MNHTAGRINRHGRLLAWIADTFAKEKEQPYPAAVPIPAYLEETYWWAYVRPYAISFFDRQWIVNLILLGNMAKLQNLAFKGLGSPLHGRTLQIASVYGNFSTRLAQHLSIGGLLDIVDVVPAQLVNLRRKFPPYTPIRLIQNDSTSLQMADASYDQAIMFFLLHEMPRQVRDETLSEALRVIKPGGKLVIVDFHKPAAWNPFRYLYPPMFKLLEPYALDIWKHEIEEWLPRNFMPVEITKETIFGGLYQKVVIHT